MKNEIAVSIIEIKIKDHVIRLTPEELKELKSILDATFPEGETKWYPYSPIPAVVIPEPKYPLPDWPYRRWDIGWPLPDKVYCGGGNTTGDPMPDNGTRIMCLSQK